MAVLYNILWYLNLNYHINISLQINYSTVRMKDIRPYKPELPAQVMRTTVLARLVAVVGSTAAAANLLVALQCYTLAVERQAFRKPMMVAATMARHTEAANDLPEVPH